MNEEGQAFWGKKKGEKTYGMLTLVNIHHCFSKRASGRYEFFFFFLDTPAFF
jgi:hypothetical protein